VGEAGPPLAGRRVYLCTPDRPDLERFLAACVAGGVDMVQLRDKRLEARPLLTRAVLAARVCRDHGVPFVLNDRPDLALDAEADGVHVGQEDATPSLARRILGPDALVGLSTHAPAQLDASRDEVVDYVSAGPVVPTPTKPGRPGTGLDYVSYAAARAARPVFVTGGVTPETVVGLVRAGGRRFVVVRWLTDADDPRAHALALCVALDRALEAAQTSYAGQPLLEGMILVRTQLLQTLQDEGLDRIPVLGLPFDPAVSESVGTEEVKEAEQHHIVVKELLRGYRLNGRIARPSRVVIGTFEGAPSAEAASSEPSPAIIPAPVPPAEAASAPPPAEAATPAIASPPPPKPHAPSRRKGRA